MQAVSSSSVQILSLRAPLAQRAGVRRASGKGLRNAGTPRVSIIPTPGPSDLSSARAAQPRPARYHTVWVAAGAWMPAHFRHFSLDSPLFTRASGPRPGRPLYAPADGNGFMHVKPIWTVLGDRRVRACILRAASDGALIGRSRARGPPALRTQNTQHTSAPARGRFQPARRGSSD